MSKIKEAFELVNLDFTALAILDSGGTSLNYDEFNISPKDFLQYAKEDFHSDPEDEKNIINSLSNSKRAIDCQLDEMFVRIGVDYKKLPVSLHEYIKIFDFKDDLAFKVKVVQALNLAPGYLLSKYRNLRNKLEHNYELPSKESVKEAIDIADLFIRCVNGGLGNMKTDFYISDEKNYTKDSEDLESFKTGISVSYETGRFKYYTKLDGKKSEWFELLPSDPMYFSFLRIMYSLEEFYNLAESMEIVAKMIDHKIPVDSVNVSIY